MMDLQKTRGTWQVYMCEHRREKQGPRRPWPPRFLPYKLILLSLCAPQTLELSYTPACELESVPIIHTYLATWATQVTKRWTDLRILLLLSLHWKISPYKKLYPNYIASPLIGSYATASYNICTAVRK